MRGHKVEHLKGELGLCKIAINPIWAVEVGDTDMCVHVGKSFSFNCLIGGTFKPLWTFIKLSRDIFQVFIIDISLIVEKFEVSDDCGVSCICCFFQRINFIFNIIQVFPQLL